MRSKRTIYAGWGLAITAIATASIAFPAIASKAVDHRESTVWQNKVEAFQADSPETTSTHAANLTHLFTQTRATNAEMRDARRLAPITRYSVNIREDAAAVMAEHKCLSEAIYYEARSESHAGQLAVAEVIHNRVKSKHYPNSICEVVYQGSYRTTGCQFTFTCDGSMERDPKGRAWERSKKTAKLSLMGLHAPLTDRATHYHTVDISPKWAPNMRYEKTIGDHKFYSFKWRERHQEPVVTRIAVAPPAP